MRWSFVGVLVGLAFACAWLALGGWMLERTVLHPQISSHEALAVLDDPAVRDEFTSLVTGATAEAMYPGDPNAPARVRATVELVVSIPAGAELAAPTLVAIHERLIGADDGTIELSADRLALIVRDERAGGLEPLTIDVEQIGALASADRIVGVILPVAALAAAVLLALVALTRPDRHVLARTTGFGLLVAAITVVVFRFVLPVFVTPALDDSVWARVPAAAAEARLTGTLVIAGLLTFVGLALLVAAGRMGRSRRWSTPVSTYRYRDQHHWS